MLCLVLDRVFDALEFDTKRDAPGYRLRRPVRLGAMAIPDQPRFAADGASARGVGFELWREARRVRHVLLADNGNAHC